MNKEQLLLDLELEVETLHAHIKRLRKANYSLHPLDVDFLRQKIRMLYEMIFELDEFTEVKRPHVSSLLKTTKTPMRPVSKEPTLASVSETEQENEISREIEKPAKPLENSKDTDASILKEEESHPVQPNEFNKDEDTLVLKEEEPNRVEETKSEPSVSEREEKDGKPVTKIQPARKEPEVIKTTLDLFSDIPSETLSDRISSSEELSVADRLQKSQISNLRQAIGINEKFQFINDLFHGDLSIYNKTVDELNSFSSLDGCKTYLFELHVEYQWSDDLPALIKLNELLERKFS